MPFGGCNNTSYLSLDPHCSIWPEFLRLFLFVIIVSFVSSSRRFIPIIAMIIVFFVSIWGGIDNIKTGEGNISNSVDVISNLYIGYPGLLGGITAYLLYLATSYVIRVKSNATV